MPKPGASATGSLRYVFKGQLIRPGARVHAGTTPLRRREVGLVRRGGSRLNRKFALILNASDRQKKSNHWQVITNLDHYAFAGSQLVVQNSLPSGWKGP